MSWQTLTRFTFFASVFCLLPMPAVAQINEIPQPAPMEMGAVESDANDARPNVQPMRRPDRALRNGGGKGAPAKNELAVPRSEISVEMPEDGLPVLVMDSGGGFRMQLPDGFEVTPMLQVFADGRILAGRKSPLVKEVEGQMDQVELKSLISFIADDCRFFDITSEMVKSDLAASRMGIIMDAPTTELTVRLKDHSNSVAVYALPQVAGKFSDVPSVASLIAVASRCRRLVATTRLGSDEEAEAALQFVNQSRTDQAANALEFAMEHLQYAEQFVDGRRSATFMQEFIEADKHMMVYATWQVDANGNESANVSVVEQRGRRLNQ